jgi:hypothetical protein
MREGMYASGNIGPGQKTVCSAGDIVCMAAPKQDQINAEPRGRKVARRQKMFKFSTAWPG